MRRLAARSSVPRAVVAFEAFALVGTLAFCGGETSKPKTEPVVAAPAPEPTATVTATSTPSPPPPPPVDASPPPPPGKKPSDCFTDLVGPVKGPDYDQFHPVMGDHCAGTQAQKITGVEKLVFLGDSITAGTPPTPPEEYYRKRVEEGIKQRFGANVEIGDCSRWGARTWDLLGKPNTTQRGQLQQCFPTGVETKKTLFVITVGGNDVDIWTTSGMTQQEGVLEAENTGQLLGNALKWIKDPAHFPNGSYAIVSNVYEYTDTTGDLSACPAAVVTGKGGVWKESAAIVTRFEEQFMKHAVATGTDMLFLLENFCGHGYHRGDANLQCYRGANAELWFDLTCIHPNPLGHSKIAEYVLKVVDGK